MASTIGCPTHSRQGCRSSVRSGSLKFLPNLEPDFRFGSSNVPNLEPDHWFRFSVVRFRFRRGRTENQTFFCHFSLSTIKRTSLFFKKNNNTAPLLYQFKSASKYLTQAVIFCVVFPGHCSTQGPRGTS